MACDGDPIEEPSESEEESLARIDDFSSVGAAAGATFLGATSIEESDASSVSFCGEANLRAAGGAIVTVGGDL